MNEPAFKLYVKGLSTRDIESIFKEVYSKNYSASKVSMMSKKFEKHRDNWLNRPLDKSYYFLYIDALRINVRRDTVEKEAFYIVMGLKENLKREILGVYNIPSLQEINILSVFYHVTFIFSNHTVYFFIDFLVIERYTISRRFL